MKMLKKMAALLLAGVMAMALLTACGDDSTPSFAQKAEDATFASIKAATGIQVNDADLKKLAESKIDLIDVEKGTFDVRNAFDQEKMSGLNQELKENKVATVTAAFPLMKDGTMQNGGFEYEVLEVTADNIDALNKSTGAMQGMLNEQFKQFGLTIKKVGVAAKTVNGKTYVAIALTMEIKVDTSAIPQQ